MIPRHYLTQPLTSSDPIIYQNMLRLCKTQKSTPYYGEGLEAQVSMVIVENHYHSLAIDRVATELSMSERSLRRRLNQSDSSYTIFVDDLRESKAPAFLAIKGLPVSTIAYELGFNDPSNFARTFKRWTKYSTQESR